MHLSHSKKCCDERSIRCSSAAHTAAAAVEAEAMTDRQQLRPTGQCVCTGNRAVEPGGCFGTGVSAPNHQKLYADVYGHELQTPCLVAVGHPPSSCTLALYVADASVPSNT
jgi:hypothetical protein